MFGRPSCYGTVVSRRPFGSVLVKTIAKGESQNPTFSQSATDAARSCRQIAEKSHDRSPARRLL